MTSINNYNVYNSAQVDRAQLNTATDNLSAVLSSSNAIAYDWFVLPIASASINQLTKEPMTAIGSTSRIDATTAQNQSIESRVDSIIQHIVRRA